MIKLNLSIAVFIILSVLLIASTANAQYGKGKGKEYSCLQEGRDAYQAARNRCQGEYYVDLGECHEHENFVRRGEIYPLTNCFVKDIDKSKKCNSQVRLTHFNGCRNAARDKRSECNKEKRTIPEYRDLCLKNLD